MGRAGRGRRGQVWAAKMYSVVGVRIRKKTIRRGENKRCKDEGAFSCLASDDKRHAIGCRDSSRKL